MDTLTTLVAEIEPAWPGASRTTDRLADVDGFESIVEHAHRLAGARHTARPPVARRTLLVCVADHGIGGATGPARTAAAARAVARGTDPLNTLARTYNATVAVADCGVIDSAALGAGIMELAVGPGTADLRRDSAMPPPQALAALETGAALVLSLAGRGLDLLALGQIGAGGDDAAAALATALDDDGEPVGALARCGGFDLGALAGATLAAATLRIPVVVDGRAPAIAAWLAARMAPAAADYVFVGHPGATRGADRAIARLGARPVANAGVHRAGGGGALAALPVLDAAARLLAECAAGPRLPIAPDA